MPVYFMFFLIILYGNSHFPPHQKKSKTQKKHHQKHTFSFSIFQMEVISHRQTKATLLIYYSFIFLWGMEVFSFFLTHSEFGKFIVKGGQTFEKKSHALRSFFGPHPVSL